MTLSTMPLNSRFCSAELQYLAVAIADVPAVSIVTFCRGVENSTFISHIGTNLPDHTVS